MRLLILDSWSAAVDIAIRARLAGHQVKYWDKPDHSGELKSGTGFFEKIEDFNEIKRKWLDWADLIYLPDNYIYLDMLEPYRLQGYPIHGASSESARLELDRGTGQKAMDAAGIPIMESKTFYDYDEAIRHVIKHPEFLVSKPSGDALKALSYVASTPEDLCYMLDSWKKDPSLKAKAKQDGFILQERKYGIEMAVGGFFGPHGWGKYFYENFEYKKLMNDDLGVNTGEMGTLSRMVKRSKLAEKILLPMTAKLHELKYIGYVDNNAIIDEYGDPWPMEFTMRDGWPTRHNITAHIKNEDPIQWMLDIVNGVDSMECIDGEVCVSVVLAIKDFPWMRTPREDLCGIPMTGTTDLKHMHLHTAMTGKVPRLDGGKLVFEDGVVTCGYTPVVVTGVGKTISQARRDCYNAVKSIKMPNSPFYRTDIGAGRMLKQLPKLHSMGYAKGLEYS